ncbi:NAD(P)/FAD-dependent oxidoreductase [Paenibacillus silvae]|uniref:NAD(P)/FAD-dependent oxidoreductase n=1 Tax=Paenibacillus silvae TaxID=1325358 RepID=UPI0011A9DEAC|nr:MULTISPECIES: NAD(P)/FAD-dependent oxidoreductase [Paenibacillus]MCK6076446.1 NAD(P)/FAD-dependent oxidoreductase [Paenibacillus silvae]MCK6150873.1 NAD(P)/FAD-dependent oxidoreductase [Paenibacillus silvae]MCK6269133.1 NAD(P)/FAD-dependent oxidoreductase [Paenibacillus silvae]
MHNQDLYDVTIIGGGPAGLYAAFYAGMREMKVKLIEGKDELGGFLQTYSDKTIWDVGGLPPMKCAKLIEHLVQQAGTFEPTVVLNQTIDTFNHLNDGVFELQTHTSESHYTRTVIIAIGRGVAEVQRLDIHSAKDYERSNLHYTIQNLDYFAGKKVLISGGGNSAVDWALELAERACSVTVVHRQDSFRAMEHNVSQMRRKAEVYTPCHIERFYGNGQRIHQVGIVSTATGETVRLDVDEVIVSHGYTSHVSNLARCGLDMHEGMLVMNQWAETSVPGIFTAGDCAMREGKVRLIAGAFNDAIVAVNGAKKFLEPAAAGMAYVSSHNELFREKNRALHNKPTSSS